MWDFLTGGMIIIALAYFMRGILVVGGVLVIVLIGLRHRNAKEPSTWGMVRGGFLMLVSVGLILLGIFWSAIEAMDDAPQQEPQTSQQKQTQTAADDLIGR